MASADVQGNIRVTRCVAVLDHGKVTWLSAKPGRTADMRKLKI